MSDVPKYDQHQFYGRRFNAVSQETGIAFSDFGRMHGKYIKGGQSPSVPPFALDEKKLADVLKLIGWRYAHAGKNMPADVSLAELQRITTERFERYANSARPHMSDFQRNLIEEHANGVRRAGGYMQLFARIAWLSWRQGYNSVDVAKETGVSPVCVRKNLSKMNDFARKLFPEDALPVHEHKRKARMAAKRKPGDPNPKIAPYRVAAVLLAKAGRTANEAAKLLGTSLENVKTRKEDWEKLTGVKMKNLTPSERRKYLRAAWIKQGLCGVDGRDPVEPGRPECTKHLAHYQKLYEAEKAKKAGVTGKPEAQE